MSDWSFSNITTLSTPSGTHTFNAAAADTIIIDPEASTRTCDLRTTIFKKGQASGYFYAAPFLQEGQHLVLSGVVRIFSASTEAAVVAARDVVINDLMTKCKAILSTEGTLTIGSETLAVRCEQLPIPTGGFLKSVTFGLVSTTPM